MLRLKEAVEVFGPVFCAAVIGGCGEAEGVESVCVFFAFNDVDGCCGDEGREIVEDAAGVF